VPDPGACPGASRSRGEGEPIGRDSRDRRDWHARTPGARTFALLLAAYAIGHAALRVWISPGLNIDDAREAIFSQTLAWGYQPRQPPLYTWLVWATVQLAGMSVTSLTVLKYAVLAVGYAFVYVTARQILTERRLAPLAAFSLLLLLPVGWFVHDDLTQSVAVLAAAAATVYALIRVHAAPTTGRYAWLGLALALGTLSKLTYLVFAAALGLAALSVPSYRRRLLDPRGLVTVLVAGALILPYARWLAGYPDDLTRFAHQVGAGRAWSLAAVLDGVGTVLRAALYYTAPLALLFLLLFPEVYRRRPSPADGDSPAGQLVERALLAGLGLLVGGVLLNVLGHLKFRWAIPLFFLLPLYACWRLDRLGIVIAGRRLRAYAGALVVVEALVVAGILLHVYVGDRASVSSRLNTPYDVVARGIAADGFRRGTIVAGPGPLGGNLRLAFPDSRIASLETPGYVPPAAHARGGDCLVVWERNPASAVPDELQAWRQARFDLAGAPAVPISSVIAPHRHALGLTYRAFYLRLPGGAGQCR
jgi:4-amino-4-deoxy-L-arabinose transferase-like glycosyltransferase